MNVYILYNKPQELSREYASICYDSFAGFHTWEPILFEGCVPETLEQYDREYKISDDRTNWKPGHERYESKKSCFYSHFSLWIKAIELNKTIGIVEHDTHCIGDLPDELEFKGALQLSVESAARLKLQAIRQNDYERLMARPDGVHPLDISRKVNGYTPLIANMAYAITPEAAEILVSDCLTNGWYQNDDLITTRLFNIDYLLPSVIEYDKSKELGTSINYSWGNG